jgi:hypothetical protein
MLEVNGSVISEDEGWRDGWVGGGEMFEDGLKGRADRSLIASVMVCWNNPPYGE